MSLTVIIVELVWIAAVVLYCFRARNSNRLDHLRVTYSVLTVVNAGIVSAWIFAAGFRGQYPSFELVPLAITGALTGVMAFRANQLYARGTSPE